MSDVLYDNFVQNQVFVLTQKLRDAGGFDESLTAPQSYDFWDNLI